MTNNRKALDIHRCLPDVSTHFFSQNRVLFHNVSYSNSLVVFLSQVDSKAKFEPDFVKYFQIYKKEANPV